MTKFKFLIALTLFAALFSGVLSTPAQAAVWHETDKIEMGKKPKPTPKPDDDEDPRPRPKPGPRDP